MKSKQKEEVNPQRAPAQFIPVMPAPILGPLPPDVFISKLQLATRLGRSVRTIENWQRRGVLPYVKYGRSVLFKWADVEAHLQKYWRNIPSQTSPTNPN